MAPEEVLRIIHGRLQLIEGKFQSQEVVNESLRAALVADRNTQDRFDEMTSRMVKMERGMEAQNKRLAKSEKQIEALKVSQSRLEKGLVMMGHKINAIAAGGEGFSLAAGGGEASSIPWLASMESASAEADVASSCIQTPHSLEAEGESEEVVSVRRAVAAKDGARMNSLKERLKEQRQSRRTPKESDVLQSGDDTAISTMPSGESMDSRGLVDDYMLEKIDDIDTRVSDDLQRKITILEENDQRMHSTIKALQDAVKDLEKASEEAREHPVTLEYDHAAQMAKAFRGITFEAREGWERAFEELDKKVARMDYLVAQNGEKADDYHLRLITFRNEMERALAEIDDCVAMLKEAEERNTPDVKDAVLIRLCPLLETLIIESTEVSGIEKANKANYDKKPPGTAVPVSQMPSKLPEHLSSAMKRTSTFLDEGVSKNVMKKRMDEMQEQINERVVRSVVQKLEDDMKIAMTLKADSKTLEAINVKKASCIELQKFREHVADELDGMREMLVKNAANSSKMLASMTSQGGDNGEINQRFDRLYSQFQDMQRGVATFVPRSEIEIALQALLDEVKSVQRTSVDKDVLIEKLKKKADKTDVERYEAIPLLSISVLTNVCHV